MKAILNHVALLTASVQASAEYLKALGHEIGPEEDFPGGGTKEIYVGNVGEERGLLLLMEPTREGSYQRALNKRGPGLHHIAIDVPELKTFITSLSGTGWFLLPKSIHTVETQKTAWLARPGFPALIELQERQDMALRTKSFISKLEIPNFAQHSSLLAPFSMKVLAASPDENFWLTLRGEKRQPIAAMVRKK
jgi:hypothetical protein